MWTLDEDIEFKPATDFLELLYGEDKIKEEVYVKAEDFRASDIEDHYAHDADVIWPPPTHSTLPHPLASSAKLESRRNRSRSPIRAENGITERQSSKEAVIRLSGKDGDTFNPVDEKFLAPDEHQLFRMRENRQPAGLKSSERARGRSSRRGRGGTRARVECSVRLTAGGTLTEIDLNDSDVPADLIALVRSVISHRKSKMKGHRSVVHEDAGNEFLVATDSLFEWSPVDSFRPTEEPFKPERTGSTISYSTPYSAFRSYWDDQILQHIVEKANAYASTIPSTDFQSEWVPTNLNEILVLFSFWMMLSIVRMPTIKSCFCTDPLLQTSVYRCMFTLKRYLALVRALRFLDNDTAETTLQPNDRMYQIRPILQHLNEKFQANYTPSENICIDKGLSLSNDSKFSIKMFELCESVTRYLWSFVVYSGSHTSLDSSKPQKSTGTVFTLIKPLLNKGYRLFMDSWFNSPLLFRFLKRNGTDCVGTLRPDRQDLPPILNLCKLKQGQMVGRHSGDVCVMAWQDIMKMTMMSTCHGLNQGLRSVSSVPSRDKIKPQVVLDHKKFMGGVDLQGLILEPYLDERRMITKWYMKLFKRLLNCSIMNSRILLQSSTSKYHDHFTFRLRLVDDILANHLSLCPVSCKQENPLPNL